MSRRTGDDEWRDSDDRDEGPEEWEDPDEADQDEEEDELGTETCPHCGREVVEQVQRCPYCGDYISPDGGGSRRPVWIVIGVIVALVVVGIWVLY